MTDEIPAEATITREPTVTVSISRKVNLENIYGPSHKYESAEFFVCLSGIRTDMTSEDIAGLLSKGKDAWEQVRVALVEQVRKTTRPQQAAAPVKTEEPQA